MIEALIMIIILIIFLFIAPVMMHKILYLFAKITYKKAHKNVKKVHKSTSKNVNVIFDIDSKGKTLQEIQLERMQMTKILGGI